MNLSAWWTLHLQGLSFEILDSQMPDSVATIGTVNTTIIVDSGTSYLLIGEEERNKYIELLHQDRGIFCHDDFLPVCLCEGEEKFPDIKI